MGLFEDLNQFLESRLDQFLQSHPHLELMALEEQLRGQEEDAIALLGTLKQRQKQLEDSILATAQEVQRWHQRVQKANAANRPDLLQPALEREATLLRQGNHLWGQRKGIEEQIAQTRQLQQQIHGKRRELKSRIAQAQAAAAQEKATIPDGGTNGWYQNPYQASQRIQDPLEEAFQRWETEAELEDLKRNMGR